MLVSLKEEIDYAIQQILSFSEIDRLHRKERAKDRKRIASGKATAQQVQDENSLIPYGAKIKFTNFRSFLKEAYS